MDLISREAVDDAMYNYCHSCDVNESQMENYFCDLPSAFEGMTNGEVIKALFPNALRSDYIENDMLILYLQDENESEMVVPEDWWNSPYQKGGEA